MIDENEALGLSLDQKLLAVGTGIFAGLGTLWLINDLPDAIVGTRNPYQTVKETMFNLGVPTFAYVSATASFYLLRLFPNENNST